MLARITSDVFGVQVPGGSAGGHRRSDDPASGTSCNACLVACTYLEQFMGDEGTQDFIVSKLDELCALVGESEREKCRATLSRDGKDLLKWLDQMLEHPMELCEELGLCGA